MRLTFDNLGRMVVKALEEEGFRIVPKEFTETIYTAEEMKAMEDISEEYRRTEYD